jgi:hypothetical protein
MARFMTRLALLLFLSAASGRLFACDCAEATVLWIDPDDRRYYVSLDEATELTVRAKVYDLVAQIQTEQPTWLGAVRISFLAHGTKAEPHLPTLTEHLADYDQAESRLTWGPGASKPRSSELFVSIPNSP